MWNLARNRILISVIAELQEIGGNLVRQMRGLQATTTENESRATDIEEQELSNTTGYQVKLVTFTSREIYQDRP